MAYGANSLSQERNGYVKLNGVIVWQASWSGEHANLRGVNTILIDPYSCTATKIKRFDTFHKLENANLLRDYLNQLNKGFFSHNLRMCLKLKIGLPILPNFARSHACFDFEMPRVYKLDFKV